MAHPMKSSAAGMMSDKLHRMTRDYGAADPSANIAGSTDKYTQNGPQESAGFGDNGSAPKARADRSSRKNKTALTNPIPTYATGGAVNRARGGRTKHKPSTHVNVIVAPQGGAAAGGPSPLPIGGPAAGPTPPPVMPTPRPPMGPPPMAGGMPPGPMPPGGGMPGLRAGGGRTYKKGGRVNRADGGTVDDNMVLRPPVPGAGKTGGPYSPSDKEQVDGRAIPRKAKGGAVHSDEKEDKELIKKTLKEEGLTPARAMGGKVDMHAGALSGPGRLEKIKLYGKNAHMKPQAV